MSRNRRARRAAAREQKREVPAPPAGRPRLDFALLGLLGVLLGVSLYRFVMMSGSPGPPGSDPGNWLAFTHELFGDSAKAADSTYFPVTLVLLKGLLGFLPELVALKVLGVGASVLLGVPFYLILRRGCSPVIASGLTLALLLAGYQLETLAHGGYPQLLATSFLLATFLFLDEGLVSGRRRPLLFAAGAAALVAGTHHFTLLVLGACLPVYLGLAGLRQRSDLRTFLRRAATWTWITALFSLPFLPWYVDYLLLMEGNAALNASGEQLDSLSETLSYVFSEAPVTWVALLALASPLAWLPVGGPGAARIRPVAAALVVPPLLLYLTTSEARAFQPMQGGVLLSVGTVAAGVEYHLRVRGASIRPSILRLERAAVGMALVGLLTVVVTNGNLRFEGAINRYGGIDASAVEALQWMRRETPPDSIVLANGRGRWVNYAWWVEGLGERPTYGLILPSFLSFGEEREQAEIARRLISPETTGAEVRNLLDRTGIEYLFIYKPSGGSFQNLLDKVPAYLSFENDDFVVLRMAPTDLSARS